MKYIIGVDGAVIIFSRFLSHYDVARSLGMEKPVSAGFVEFSGDGISTYGESITLNLPSLPGDHEKIARQIVTTNID